MHEWQILESDSFPEPPPEEPAPGWRRQSWSLLAGGLLLFLLLAGGLTLRERRAQGQAALQQDLSLAIFEEESRRFSGRLDEALLDPTAPLGWQQAYWLSYEEVNRPASPNDVQLATIDYFDGDCAIVTVTGTDGQRPWDPVRAFCLEAQGWRRTPVPPVAWGEEQPAIILPNSIRLNFRERDRAFAETLAEELATFFIQLDQLSLDLSSAGYHELEITIAPYDLQGPLILAGARQIILNSPLLATDKSGAEPGNLDVSAGSSGETAVRLALATTLLRRAEPVSATPSPTLPGGDRFLAAVQTVTAMRLLFSPETESSLLTIWRNQLKGGWVSPFFAELLPPAGDAPLPVSLETQAKAAALLTADYIYRLNGLEALPAILELLPGAASWDAIFEPLLGRSTLALELAAARYGRVKEERLAALSRDYELFIPPLPLMATLLELDPISGGRRLSVTLPDRSEPLLVELGPEAAFETAEGLTLEPDCLGPGASLELYGKWLEQSRRLQAHQVIVRQAAPIHLEPAPPGSLAYLLIDPLPGDPMGSLAPDPRSYPVAPGSPPLLMALQRNRRLQPLLRQTQELKLFSLPIAAGESPHFLLQIDLPRCERHWFGHYEPASGLSEQWFSPLPLMQWVWRPDRPGPIFLKRGADRLSYDIYQDDRVTTFAQAGLSDAPLWFMGWHSPSRQIISVRFRMGEAYLGLIDPGSGQATEIAEPPFHALEAHGLSPAGRWLVYPAGMPALSQPPTRLNLLDLSSASTGQLLQLERQETLRFFSWSPYLARPVLVILTQAQEQRPPGFSRLLLARPEQPGEAIELAAGPWLTGPIFCSDGALLYRTEGDGRYSLQRQQPGHPTEILLTLDHPFRPFACP